VSIRPAANVLRGRAPGAGPFAICARNRQVMRACEGMATTNARGEGASPNQVAKPAQRCCLAAFLSQSTAPGSRGRWGSVRCESVTTPDFGREAQASEDGRQSVKARKQVAPIEAEMRHSRSDSSGAASVWGEKAVEGTLFSPSPGTMSQPLPGARSASRHKTRAGQECGRSEQRP